MTATKHTLEEIDKFFSDAAIACDDGIRVAKESGIYGMEIDEALVELRKRGLTTEYAWLKIAMKSAAYVRYNGKEITVHETYQVFDPVTGVHTEYGSVEEARVATTTIARSMLDRLNVTVCKAISNENGDTAWEPVDLLKIEVTLN